MLQMPANPHLTATLTIAASDTPLQVIAVIGDEHLNAAFSYTVALVSPEAALDCAALAGVTALLRFGTAKSGGQRVHGVVQSCLQRYRGAQLSLYQLTLMPALQQLEGPLQHRSFNGQSVPQILTWLLLGNGVPRTGFRFEHMTGHYPPRRHCIQFGESDLHFLHRLCEEEGISFRFEHKAHSHTVVFADDPATFTEWPAAAAVEHLAEQFSARICYSTHAGAQYEPWRGPALEGAGQASNQPQWSGANSLTPRQQQLGRRQLERQRCERRDIRGRSQMSWLRSGVVMRIEGHEQTHLNDQWLLTGVHHRVLQLNPLRGCRSDDVIGILQALPDDHRALTEAESGPDARARLALAHYSNQFQVMQWALPFRPALVHAKPCVHGSVGATLTDGHGNVQGEVRVRYDWQPPCAGPGERDSLARVVSQASVPTAGDRLQVRFFGGDPDQPYVQAIESGQPGSPTTPLTSTTPKPARACLRIDSLKPLIINTAHATLTLTHQGVRLEPRKRQPPV